MTTIAWDGATLAADRQSTWGGTPIVTRKVFKLQAPDGSFILYGGSGNSIQLGAFHRYVLGQTWRVPCIDDAQFMMIDQQRRVWVAQNNMDWHRIDVRQWAMGSGADYALGAMAHGANARESVKVASRLDTGTGMGIDCVRF